MEKNLSLALNNVLRHKLDEYRIPYDEEGYARIDSILGVGKISRLGASFEDVVRIVQVYQHTERKLRFQIKGEGWDRAVRCTEAHSLHYLNLNEAHIKVEMSDMEDALV